MFKKLSFSQKLLFSILAVFFLASSISTFLITKESYTSSKSIAKNAIKELTIQKAFQIQEDFDKSIVLSYGFSASIESLIQSNQMIQKETISKLMINILKKNPYVYGIWFQIDAGAIFNNIPEMSSKLGHDKDGRFAPYITRNKDKISIQGGSQQSRIRPWVDIPKKTGKEFITEPYFETLSGEKVLMTTISVPVYNKNKDYIGAVGIDIKLDKISEYISTIKINNTGYGFLITNKGSLVGTNDKKSLGKKIQSINDDSFDKKLPSLVSTNKELFHEKISSKNGLESLYFIYPFEIGNTDVLWGLTVCVPKKEYLESTYSNMWHSILINLVVFSIISLALLYSIRKLKDNLSKIDKGLKSFFNFLNKQSKNIELIKIDSQDEFGKMGQQINENITNIQEGIIKDQKCVNEVLMIVKELKDGKINNVANAHANNPDLQLLTEHFNEMILTLQEKIGKNLIHISNTLTAFSNYDFNQKVPQNKGEIESLINKLGDDISLLLKKSQEVGYTLENTSIELVKNVNNLNISSNEAAANLEETAAALEQITSSINNNTNNVEEMLKSSKELSSTAKEGQTQAHNTEVSMKEISEQVNLINEAISVIDQIAFQTNILSLNAAVEAATAGEAGKGFAVVAQEVRNLANRSAEAAKEIKELVECANSKAKEGEEISHNMISGYNTLFQNITDSTEIISQITSSSNEQKSGINQINKAITQLDNQTQQNANIANQANDIANKIDTISNEIVNDTKSKNFIGKI